MPASRGVPVEVRAGAAFEFLIALSALTDDRRGGRAHVPAAVAKVGDTSGETWLHLLGLALESDALTARDFVADVEAVEPLEFRRHLLGVHVPAWRTVAGAETLERAARGDRAAAARLLADDRYYAGNVREALGAVLPLTPRQTKQRFVAALRAFVSDFEQREEAVVAALEDDARRRRAAIASAAPEVVIAGATGGYVYEPEPELARVILVPHLAAAPSLLLCQHGDARLICYPVERPGDDDVVARAVRLGKALSDPVRVRILRALVAGEASLTDVARTAEIAKSTAHHHLGALRAAGLVSFRGNARGYWYAIRLDGVAESRAVLGDLVSP